MISGASHTTEIFLLAAGVYAGPGLGHVYSENTQRAVKGAAIRIGITLATYLTLSATGICLESCDGRNEVLPALALLGGLGLTLGSMVLDIGSAPSAAARFNADRQLSMKLVPVVYPSRGRVGIAVRLNF